MKAITSNKNYVLIYILINVGFLLSFNFKYNIPILDYITKGYFIAIFIFTCFDYFYNYFKTIETTLDKHETFREINISPITDCLGKIINRDSFHIISIILLLSTNLIFPLILAYQITDKPTIIEIIRNLILIFILIFTFSNTLKYGYLTPNDEKRNLNIYFYAILFIFTLTTFMFPDALNTIKEKIYWNFTDLVVISLTFILMTATLALLAFTYKMIVTTNEKLEIIGKNYFIATIFIIFSSIIIFTLFSVLKILDIKNWNALLSTNYPLLIGINIISILVIVLAYLLVNYLKYFQIATTDCLKELNLYKKE